MPERGTDGVDHVVVIKSRCKAQCLASHADVKP